jgi:hypothetical protein
MKGVVFAEFIEMVEEKFSLELADRIIHQAELASGGAYTSLGTYDHCEIIKLVENLSQETQIPVAELVKVFGQHLAQRFHQTFPVFFQNSTDMFEFLHNVDSYIHVEVKKLYPDAELPSITCTLQEAEKLHLNYSSRRPFADLAEGLILGIADIYNVKLHLERNNLPCVEGANVEFLLTKV